jgi:hypothetical protein
MEERVTTLEERTAWLERRLGEVEEMLGTAYARIEALEAEVKRQGETREEPEEEGGWEIPPHY